MKKLAMNGGAPIRKTKWPLWPVADARESELLDSILGEGKWSYNGKLETQFRGLWADYIGTKHAIPVANGTVSLQLCLEALDIGFGDEVIVPGLTWQATAACVIDVNAVPVFVDVEEDSWCIDPKQIEAAITARTKAIIVVHLYGTICDMDAILQIADRHGLYVIEDAAHQHGSVFKGKKIGNLAHVASFSLQNSKVFTCGEGGVITTNDDDIAEKLDALRNCGRRPVKETQDGHTGNYAIVGNFIQSGNYRITEFQAAVLLGQLEKFEPQVELRERNALHLNKLINEQGLLKPMRRQEGTDRQSYFNIAFRYDEDLFKGLHIDTFRRAMSAELDYPFTACYQPLNDCELYSPLTKKRHQLSEEYTKQIDPKRFKLKEAERAYKSTSVCAHHKLLLGTGSDMEQVAEAVQKIWDNASEIL